MFHVLLVRHDNGEKPDKHAIKQKKEKKRRRRKDHLRERKEASDVAVGNLVGAPVARVHRGVVKEVLQELAKRVLEAGCGRGME